MKKIFTYSVAMALFGLSLPAFAQDAAPCLTMTMERDAVEETLSFQISAEGGAAIQVDWGDGELKSYSIADYGVYGPNGYDFTKITGTVAGTQIKVYTSDASKINYLTASKDLEDGENAFIRAINLSQLTGIKELVLAKNHIASLDVSALTAMTSLTATDNQLTSLTLPSNATKLTTIDVSNAVDTTTGSLKDAAVGNNQVLSTDWSKAPNLTILRVSGNSYKELGWFDDFDVSANSKLTTLDINCCYIPSLDVTHMTGLKTLNAQWNEFTTMDLSKMTYSKATVWLTHNNLTSVKLPEGAKGMTRVNLAYNALTFATLPAPGITTNAGNYVYNNQDKLIINLSSENIVNLSDQKVGDTMSKVVWTAILDGQTEPVELSADAGQYNETEPGVFRFNVPVKDLSGVITNEALPNLSLATTTATSVGLLPEILTLEVNRSETADGIFLGLIDSEGQNVFIDWGDGKYEGPYTIAKNDYDSSSPTMPGVKLAESWLDDDVAAPLKGNTIKVKGNPKTIITVQINGKYDWTTGTPTTAVVKDINISALTNLEKISLYDNALSSIDLSTAPELKSVNLRANKLTSFDFNLPNVFTLDISNEFSSGKVTFGENKITEIDFEKLPALKSLTANACGLKPDFSKAANLTTVYLQGNDLTEFAPVSATLTTLSMNFSTELTKFDASGLTSSSVNVFLNNNKLGATKESLKLSPAVNNLNIANGLFTFSTLPAVNSVKGTLTYSPQSAMAAEYKDGNVNLADQAKVGDTATEYVWKLNGEAVDDVTATSDGIFTFKYNGEYTCSMTNAEFPKLTLNTVPVTVTGNQDRPVKLFSFTVAPEAVGKTMLLNISSTDHQSVTVDWGNGTLSNPIPTKNYDIDWKYGEVPGTIEGTEIIVYGVNAAAIDDINIGYTNTYDEATKLLTIDLTQLSGLKDVDLSSNNLTALDLSANKLLTTLRIPNNRIAELTFPENCLIDILQAQNNAGDDGYNNLINQDWSKLPALTYLNINYNNKNNDKAVPNFECLTELKSLYLESCGLEEINISKNTKLTWFTAANNNLETIDVSTVDPTCCVFVQGNRLKEIIVGEALKRLNIQNNYMTFTTLPAIDKVTQSTAYFYENQKPVVVKAEGAVVDLSSQAKVGDTETVYTWTVGAEEFKDVTISNGVSTFTKTAENAVCSMTNAEYPKLTLTTIPVTVEVAGSGVEDIEAAEEGEAIYFNLQGVKVDGTTPGVYIRVLNGKSRKVIVK